MSSTSTFGTSSHLISSTSSLTSSQYPQSPHVARTYKQASQLFLTRRVGEALELVESLINIPKTTPSEEDHGSNGLDSVGSIGATPEGASDSSVVTQEAPIATATRAARVKVWSLYISIINEVSAMTADEGSSILGSTTKWKELIKKARDGTIWDEVVNRGYGGNDGAVDADVVANLATLLLAQSPTQKLTQQKLESYLSSSSTPTFDVTSYMSRRKMSPSPNGNGTSTPRDLNSRLKILEIYALYVLPSNNEWEYAREFVNMSEILDDERREAFQQALQSLQEEKAFDARKEEQLNRQRQEQQQRLEEERKRKDVEQQDLHSVTNANDGSKRRSDSPTKNEQGYGMDGTLPTGSLKPGNRNTSATNPPSKSISNPGSKSSSVQQAKPTAKKSRAPQRPQTLYKRAAMLMVYLQQSVLNMGQGFSKQPLIAFRTVLLVLALLMALARRDVRDRLARVTETAWEKVKRTVGMGVKVSYL